MEKLLIIDAESLIKRAFYAIPNMSDEENLYTNAIYGFTKMLFEVKNKIQPNFISAVLNKKENDIKAFYKQKPFIKEILENTSASVYEKDDVYIYDYIASLVNDGQRKSMEIYILTADKTLLQLSDDNVKIIYINSGINNIKIYDKASFIDEYAIEPKQYIGVLALDGSKYNCIDGINTIGELAKADKNLVHSVLKKHGDVIWGFANGEDFEPVGPEN
ncbi:MAG: hypothetical protein MJ191_06880, partial [Clostridium sp.]|nr:hypothetical protein [Clostridium sp.]